MAVTTHAARSLAELIEQAGLAPPESVARARAVQAETGERLDAVMARLGLVSEQTLAEAAARAAAVPLAPPSDFPAAALFPEALSVRFLHEARALPIAAADDRVTVAFADPFDRWPALALAQALGRAVEPRVARISDIENAVDRLYGTVAADAPGDDAIDSDDLDRLRDLASDAPAIRAVNRLITRAVEARASDIHIEPTEEQLAVRLRIDGMLHEQEPLPAAMKAPLVSRIKVMAGLNIAEKRLPQDGRVRFAVRGHQIDLRIATAPTIHGETVVMRLLDRSNLSLDFATLGFDDATRARLDTVLAKPHGIMLVTGPTGSGKTTTLYAALAQLNRPERKLLTVEDPIEYRLPGVQQTQVQPAIGLSFAQALRSFLRQDPDIIMVGEIRDLETAQVAVQAALTGHMILSTLHTNSAAAAVTRLMDMGVEPFLITSTVHAVLAQRLVRRLCADCRAPYRPSPSLATVLGNNAQLPDTLFHATGCAACKGSGFKGRVALTELLELDDGLAMLVTRQAEARDIERAAVAQGMRTMLADGVLKAGQGLTTIEEVVRVTREA